MLVLSACWYPEKVNNILKRISTPCTCEASTTMKKGAPHLNSIKRKVERTDNRNNSKIADNNLLVQ